MACETHCNYLFVGALTCLLLPGKEWRYLLHLADQTYCPSAFQEKRGYKPAPRGPSSPLDRNEQHFACHGESCTEKPSDGRHLFILNLIALRFRPAVLNSSPRAPPLCAFLMLLLSLQTFVLIDRKCPAKWTSHDIPPWFQFEANVFHS